MLDLTERKMRTIVLRSGETFTIPRPSKVEQIKSESKNTPNVERCTTDPVFAPGRGEIETLFAPGRGEIGQKNT